VVEEEEVPEAVREWEAKYGPLEEPPGPEDQTHEFDEELVRKFLSGERTGIGRNH
jgi:hypothetical protein